MADIILIPLSGNTPKEGSAVTYITAAGIMQTADRAVRNTIYASGYSIRFDSRLIEGIKTKSV